MNWEIGIDMYTLMCIKLMTNKDLLYKKIKLKKKVQSTTELKNSPERLNSRFELGKESANLEID